MRFSKNASLNLSINAIVILILAITMLGLGLGFMKNLFSKTTGQLGDVGEDIKNQMIGELRRSNSKLTLDQEDITIKSGDSKEIYYGVKNVLSDPVDGNEFLINADSSTPGTIECEAALDPSATQGEVTISVFPKTRKLMNGEIDVQKMMITASSQAKQTTWPCKITLTESGAVYAAKSFFVTVEK